MTTTELYKFGFLRMALVACVGIPLIITSSAFAQNPPPPPPPPTGAGPAPPSTEVERVIVTGSNIPNAEEVGPNADHTYNHHNINNAGKNSADQSLLNCPTINAS